MIAVEREIPREAAGDLDVVGRVGGKIHAASLGVILGFMPALDRRLSIATKSVTAAKVVPNPATMPTTSDR
jgi:hypothetical protein